MCSFLELRKHRLLTSATTLLTLLTNPSNVALLTNQILSAPAIWSPSISLETLAQIINVYSSASTHLSSREDASHPSRRIESPRRLDLEDWIAAVLKGTNEEIIPARQVLVLAGLLYGCQSRGRHKQTGRLRTALQEALINAVNVSLQDKLHKNAITDLGLVIALSQVFEFLEKEQKVILDHNSLLPMLGWAIFLSDHGLHQGYFLSAVDADVLEGPAKKLNWSTNSHSYRRIQSVAASPIVTALGSLSQLMAFSIACASETFRISRMLQDLVEFSTSLCIQWRQNKLSEIDGSEEVDFLTDKTLRTPLPLLWRILRSGLYTIVSILTAYTGRLLGEHLQSRDNGQ